MKFAKKIQGSALLAAVLLLGLAGRAPAQLPANIYVNATQLNFVYQTGTTGAVQPQTLQVIAEPARAFTITPTLTGGPTAGVNWLTLNGQSSTFSGTTNAFVPVGINPAGLAAGVYTANLKLEMPGLAAATTDIKVFLRVSAVPQVAVPVSFVNIQGQSGTQVSVTIPVNSTSIPTQFTVGQTRYSPPGSWLSIAPTSGTTNAAGSGVGNVTLSANLTTLPSGLYYAVINFTSVGPDPGDLSLPVILTVTQTSSISVNPTKVDFAFQAGNLTGTPNAKAVSIVGSNNSNLTYQAAVTGDPRITVSKTPTGGTALVTGTTPESIYVIVNPAGMAAGQVADATVTVASASNTVTIPVHVTVTNSPLIAASPESVNFAYSLGAPTPTAQSINLTGTSTLGFSVAEAEVTGGDWLTVSSLGGFTPGQITASLNATRLQQLAAGTYTANIVVTSPTAGNSPMTIPVTLTISGTTLLTVNPAALEFTGELNGRVPDRKTFVVQSSDASNQNYTLRVEPASPWLVLDKTSGSTGPLGDIVTVTVDPTKVSAAGIYEADIVAVPSSTQTGAVGQRVHVKFTVTTSTSVTATPARIDATQVGATPPSPVTVNIASPVAGTAFTARAEATWLSVSPTQGTTNADITITFNSAALTPGTYESAVTILPPGAVSLAIPVKLVVSSAAQLTLSQNAFTVNYSQGSPAPANLTVGLTSSGTPIAFTAAATSQGNWLIVTPTTGTTAAAGGAATNLTLAVNPAGLTPGSYTGTVAITSANASNSPQTVTVTLVVAAQATPVITAVQNAARNEATLVAPGLILAIKGTNLGPATGISTAPANGVYPTTAGEVRVLFDNIPAPLTFVRQDQVNAVAPYALFGRTSTRVVVEYRGVRSDSIEYRVVESAPGIFTQDSTGRGLGSILNQNNSVNTANNPAKRGDIVAIYATGEGQVTPAGSDGRVTTGTVETLPRPVLPVTVRINGQQVSADSVTYAGSAPGLIAGALQVNVRIPANLNITALTQVSVEISVGGAASQPGVTLAVTP